MHARGVLQAIALAEALGSEPARHMRLKSLRNLVRLFVVQSSVATNADLVAGEELYALPPSPAPAPVQFRLLSSQEKRLTVGFDTLMTFDCPLSLSFASGRLW